MGRLFYWKMHISQIIEGGGLIVVWRAEPSQHVSPTGAPGKLPLAGDLHKRLKRHCARCPQNAVVHGVGHRETPADQGPARGGHLPAEPGQQGAAAPQLGPVHHVRGGGVRVLDGRGRVHARAAVHPHRVVRGRRLLAAPPAVPHRRPVRDRGLRQADQARVPVQPPGQRERVRHRFRGLPRTAAVPWPRRRSPATGGHVVAAARRQEIAAAPFSVLRGRPYNKLSTRYFL